MPTDTLVDVVVLVKLVNVRRSQAEEAGELAGDMLGADDAIWDTAELGPLQLIGDDQALPCSDARQIKEKPVEEPEAGVSVPAPAKKVVVAPPPAPKKYARLPSDFDEKVLVFLGTEKGFRLKDVAIHFNYNSDAVWYRLDKLVKAGKLVKVKDGAHVHDPVRYSSIVPAKTLEKAEVEIAETKNLTITTPPKEPAPAPSREPVVPQQVIESFKGMRTGHDKDSDHKADIIKILSETPGINVQKISDLIRVDARRTRNLLIGLEEEHTIEAVKDKGRYGPVTGYYLKESAPREAM